MDYMSEYKRWLDCSALSADEHAERGDDEQRTCADRDRER